MILSDTFSQTPKFPSIPRPDASLTPSLISQNYHLMKAQPTLRLRLFLANCPAEAKREAYAVATAVVNHGLSESGKVFGWLFLDTYAVLDVGVDGHRRKSGCVGSYTGFIEDIPDHVESEIGLPAGFCVCDEFYARGELDGVEGVRFYINSRRVVVIESIYEAV